MAEWLKVLELLALSSVKLLMAPASCLALGFGWLETIAITFVGGMLGIVVFFYFGKALFRWFDMIKAKFGKKNTQKKVFSKNSRRLVHIKKRYGLVGMASLMPVISIPIAVMIALKYYGDDRRFFPIFFTVLFFEAIILTFMSKPIINLVESILK